MYSRSRLVALAIALLLALPLSLGATARPAQALDLGDGVTLTATLDGRPLLLADVADWYCDDFHWPAIECFSDPAKLQVQVSENLSPASSSYVTIFDGPTYSGSYMVLSQDYSILALIGWNDRISSFKVLDGTIGHFYVDWLYGGSSWGFCCNSNIPLLGSYDNSFSSVKNS